MTRTQRALVVLVPLILASIVFIQWTWPVLVAIAALIVGVFVWWVFVSVAIWIVDGEWYWLFWR